MPNEKILAQLCALSGDDVAVVAAQVQAARAQSEEGKTMWMMIAKRLAGGASTAILSVVFAIALIAGYAPSARAGGLLDAQNAKFSSLYIVSSTFLSVLDRLRRFTGFFRLWFFTLA